MFKTVTPESVGISSALVEKMIRTLNRRGLAMHSVLMMRGEDIFAEYYWKPFDKDFCHRMYSQTKSFVGVAIGLLEEDGKLKLSDPISRYFPEKIEREMPENLKDLTVRDMLMMETCGNTPSWFRHEDPDRVHLYFAENTARFPGGMRWEYDSPGSQVLSTLVEKLSGMSLFDFLNARIFEKLGTFKTASVLKTKTNDSFGDSAMLCTTRDIASFARFVMNYGTWHGEGLMNEAFLRTATSRLADNDEMGFDGVFMHGYGYQIWRTAYNGFAFNGMGCQLTVCLPEKDLIFTCTADNQGYAEAKSLILTAFYDLIVENIADGPLEEDPAAYARCLALEESLELLHLSGETDSPYADTLNGKVYVCEENPTGITRFSLHFTAENSGELHYTNAQGDKVLPFGLGKNVFGKFPEYGYSDLHAGARTTNGFLYDCAASAAWRESQKLCIKVQIIDKYFGNLFMMFSFKEDRAVIRMTKTAEDFLDEYTGTFNAIQR